MTYNFTAHLCFTKLIAVTSNPNCYIIIRSDDIDILIMVSQTDNVILVIKEKIIKQSAAQTGLHCKKSKTSTMSVALNKHPRKQF